MRGTVESHTSPIMKEKTMTLTSLTGLSTKTAMITARPR